MHIIDKINQEVVSYEKKKLNGGNDSPLAFFSFEYFPPKTEQGVNNLMHRIDRMVTRFSPLFVDVTWGSAASTLTRSLQIASHAQRYSGVDVLLHLTLSGMNEQQLKSVLDQAKSAGIQNILALRGDDGGIMLASKGCDGGMTHAVDLVRFIRKYYGDYFGIAVAGHPEGHERSEFSLEEEVVHLKEKIEAGADFIITQFFYDPQVFVNFVHRCRNEGINCPILPGVMPIQSFSSFQRMTGYCGTRVPTEVFERLSPIKDNDEAVKEVGCQITIDLCQSVINAGACHGVHFYTLNLERSTSMILERMMRIDNALDEGKSKYAGLNRTLPWRQSALEKRSKQEDVRPIHWANRPKSYVLRTEAWDEFPNGRWGPSTSPAFGELSDSHFYSYTMGSEEDRRVMLGEAPISVQEINEVFAMYLEGVISHIPWCETPLQPESFVLQKPLAALNRNGFLTLNSQPSVNGARSDDPVYGWGGKGGYVYQKAYVECFISSRQMSCLKELVSSDPRLNLYAVNCDGKEDRVGIEEDGVTALTWGVFPNREVLQPTIFDPAVFVVWAEEAFLLWKTMWQNLYESGSVSWELIEDIHDSYFLVAIIDHDFVGDSNHLWNALLSL